MLITLDSNILLDVLLPNAALYNESKKVILLSSINGNFAYTSASSITDIFYIRSLNAPYHLPPIP